MADENFMLQASVQRMSTLGVIEALALCRQFGMHSLALRYSEALAERLTANNFIQVRNYIIYLFLLPCTRYSRKVCRFHAYC